MASSYHELITIQCGHYANHVGTHCWNIQEAGLWYPPVEKGQRDEIESDCTFREGLTLTGRETYTPRLIAIDLSGSLESLKQDGHLYNVHEEESLGDGTWGGPLEKLVSEPHKKNEFVQDLDDLDEGRLEEKEVAKKSYSLESCVRVWSDFLRPHLHPKSLMIVPGYFHEDEKFNVWPSGLETWKDRQFQVDLEDRLHFFLEECDSFQGFQFLFDQHNGGFSAIATMLTQLLHDEHSTKPIITFAVTPPLPDNSMTRPFVLQHSLNSLLTVPDLQDYSSLLVPLSLSTTLWPMPTSPLVISSLQYSPLLHYHSAAVLSAAIETATSCYRSSLYPETVGSVCGLLSNSGRKISSLSFSLPAGLPTPPDLSLDSFRSVLQSCSPLTPHCSSPVPVQLWSQAIGIRGYPSNSGATPSPDPVSSSPDPYSTLIHHTYSVYPSTNSQLGLFSKPLIVNSPFPHIAEFREETKSTKTVGSVSALQSHSGIHTFLDSLLDQGKRCDPRQVPSYLSCLEIDTYHELLDSVKTIRDNYWVGPPSECSSDEEN